MKYVAAKTTYKMKYGDLVSQTFYVEQLGLYSTVYSHNILDAIIFDTAEKLEETVTRTMDSYNTNYWFAQPIDEKELFMLRLKG